MVQRLQAAWQAAQRWRALRSWQRFGQARGNLLAAGIAYFAFFSLFPALALAAVIFGFVLAGRPELLDAVGESLNHMLPGFVQTPANPDGLLRLSPPATATLSWAGVVATVTLVLSGLGVIGSLRDGIRAVFGVQGSPGNAVTDKLRDLGVLALLGSAVLLSAGLTTVSGGALAWLADRFSIGGLSASLIWLAGVLVSLLVDTLVMVILLRVLSGVPLPWRDIRQGALLGAAGLTLLKLVGAQLIAQATRNPLFGSIVVVVGLLFWLNLIGRLVLLAAAWAANDIDDSLARLQADHPERPERAPLSDQPGRPDQPGMPPAAGAPGPRIGALLADDPDAGVDPADDLARARAGLPTLTRRDQDRVSVAAGAVLGAGAALSLGAALRGLRRSLRN